jgi:hypothetical protein
MSKQSNEAVIDRSPEQRQARVAQLTLELEEIGYSVVKSDWLSAVMTQNKRKTLVGVQ